MPYSFRIRFVRSPRDTINIDSPSWEIISPDEGIPITFRSREKNTPVSQSRYLILQSSGWASGEDALRAGQRYQDALMLSLARLRIGADFGSRAPKSFVTEYGLSMLEQQKGQNVLNDVHGLMTFKSDAQPLFVSAKVSPVRGVQQEQFERIFSYAIQRPREISDRERLSLELFNASFFQSSEDARFLLLVMAVEALIETSPRSKAAIEHVEDLLKITFESQYLSKEEKKSISSTLQYLRQESINQSGQKLAKERLESRKYGELEAQRFFSKCYHLRSRLVHGAVPMPSREKVSIAAAHMEMFVSDLLSGTLKDIE